MSTDLRAGMPVCDLDASRDRYARLFGPESDPGVGDESLWDIGANASVFAAHVPDRIAADKFMEEIGTLPWIIGGVGETSGERAAQRFQPRGAPIDQTTPVQAELAKSRTGIAEAAPDALLVDRWNALGTAQVFAYVAEAAALRA